MVFSSCLSYIIPLNLGDLQVPSFPIGEQAGGTEIETDISAKKAENTWWASNTPKVLEPFRKRANKGSLHWVAGFSERSTIDFQSTIVISTPLGTRRRPETAKCRGFLEIPMEPPGTGNCQ